MKAPPRGVLNGGRKFSCVINNLERVYYKNKVANERQKGTSNYTSESSHSLLLLGNLTISLGTIVL